MVKKLPKASAMAAVQSEMHQLVSEQSDHPTHFGDDEEAHQEIAGEGAMGVLGAIPESDDHLQAQCLADRIGGVENQVKDLASQNLVILAQLQHLAQQVGGLVAASKPNRELMGEIPSCAMSGKSNPNLNRFSMEADLGSLQRNGERLSSYKQFIVFHVSCWNCTSAFAKNQFWLSVVHETA